MEGVGTTSACPHPPSLILRIVSSGSPDQFLPTRGSTSPTCARLTLALMQPHREGFAASPRRRGSLEGYADFDGNDLSHERKLRTRRLSAEVRPYSRATVHRALTTSVHTPYGCTRLVFTACPGSDPLNTTHARPTKMDSNAAVGPR